MFRSLILWLAEKLTAKQRTIIDRGADFTAFRFGSSEVLVKVLRRNGGFFAWVPGHDGAWANDREGAVQSALAAALAQRIEGEDLLA